MRLTVDEAAAIRKAASEIFGTGAVVRLFGSRVDDSLRGGDIDLHIEVSDLESALSKRGQFIGSLNDVVGERDYDVIVAGRGMPPSAIDRRATEQGIIL